MHSVSFTHTNILSLDIAHSAMQKYFIHGIHTHHHTSLSHTEMQTQQRVEEKWKRARRITFPVCIPYFSHLSHLSINQKQ